MIKLYIKVSSAGLDIFYRRNSLLWRRQQIIEIYHLPEFIRKCLLVNNIIEMDDYNTPIEGKTYLSPSLKSFDNPNRQIRIATKKIDSNHSYAFAKILDETVLRLSHSGSKKITAKFFEDDNGIFVLSIQGYTAATEKPHNASFSFIGQEINTLIEFLNNIQKVVFENSAPLNINDEELKKMTISNNQAHYLLKENEEVFKEIIKNELTKEDLVSIGYRKRQIIAFENLLVDEKFFDSALLTKKCSPEGLWQRYFEKNKWIFGYGLGYVFLSSFDQNKLEQVVQGFSVNHHGKRVDGLMKTKGVISNLCFVEIKTHKTELLESKPYRSGCYAPSRELSGAIAQVQGTVASAIENLTSKLNPSDKEGNPSGEEIFNYKPKSYLVIGNLNEFVTENGVNQDKYRSFELYRRSILQPEILTFDELFERAKFIVFQNENANPKSL